MLEVCFALLLATPAVDPSPGSLLFLENSNKAVERLTDGEISHVAIVLPGKSGPVVYEATPPRVRKVAWYRYLEELAEYNERRDEPMIPLLAGPDRPWSEAEIECMQAIAESQIDRPYSVKGHVRKRAAEGVHCAEFAAMCLQTTELFPDEPAYAFTPQSLHDCVDPSFAPAAEVSLAGVRPPDASWGERVRTRWSGYWSWCRWSCWETWRFCW